MLYYIWALLLSDKRTKNKKHGAVSMPLFFAKRSMIVIRRHACNDSIIHFHLLREIQCSTHPCLRNHLALYTLFFSSRTVRTLLFLFPIIIRLLLYNPEDDDTTYDVHTYVSKIVFLFLLIPPASHRPCAVKLGAQPFAGSVLRHTWSRYIHVLL